ncbi:MAG: hypothetical protein AAFX01_03185 [Cyanobacteria bacterium J06638_28]
MERTPQQRQSNGLFLTYASQALSVDNSDFIQTWGKPLDNYNAETLGALLPAIQVAHSKTQEEIADGAKTWMDTEPCQMPQRHR